MCQKALKVKLRGQKGNKMKRKKEHLLLFGLVSGSEGRKQSLQRESLTSLLIFRHLDRRFSSEQEEKLVYTTRATREHQFCGVSTTPGGRGFLLLDLILI